MNITKEQADKVIAALEDSRSQVVVYGQDYHPGLESVVLEDIDEALTIMRGLEDAAPVCNHEWFQTGAMLSNEKRCIQCGEWGKLYTSPQAAQTALKSESLAQAAQALAQPPSEGKPIEALAPIQAAQTDERNGCLSNCRNCQHFRRDTGGHCYMFKDEPQGVCAQFKASWAFW